MSIIVNCISVSNAEEGMDVPKSEANADFLSGWHPQLPSRLRAARPPDSNAHFMPSAIVRSVIYGFFPREFFAPSPFPSFFRSPLSGRPSGFRLSEETDHLMHCMPQRCRVRIGAGEIQKMRIMFIFNCCCGSLISDDL